MSPNNFHDITEGPGLTFLSEEQITMNNRLGPLRQDPRGGVNHSDVTRLESIGGFCLAVVIGVALACVMVVMVHGCKLTGAGVVCEGAGK